MNFRPLQDFARFARRLAGQDWSSQLDRLEGEIAKRPTKRRGDSLRVLIGPSFAIYPPSYALDRLLSCALRLRGVDVIPVYCDAVQRIECNYFGGEWGGKENFGKNCANCVKTSENLWRSGPHSPVRLSSHVSTAEIERVRSGISALSTTQILQYREKGLPFGQLAKDILGNSYLVGDIALIDGFEHLLRVHLENLLVVSLAYERILETVRPDRVVSNDSYYGMWAIMEHHCRERRIPFYSHYPVTNSRVAFASDDAAMNLDFSRSWPAFSKLPLREPDGEKLERWLAGNRGYVIDTTRLAGHEQDDPALAAIDPRKPTLVLVANVIWDLAALNKQLLFGDMMDWIVQTIDWFGAHGDYQLVIRPHPGETAPQIPRTIETVESAVLASGVKRPPNVFLLKPDARITLNELLPRFNVTGMVVHTSTVGFEYAARGIRVITTAKSPYRGYGFTEDPATREDYFAAMGRLLSAERKELPREMQELARKFIKFYQFHYYADLGLFAGNPPKIRPDVMSTLESDGGPFGYVIDAILEGRPINDVDRWIPES